MELNDKHGNEEINLALDELHDSRSEKHEKFMTPIICLTLFLCFVFLVYFYLGDPLHIIGITPHSYEQTLTEESLPSGYVDAFVISLDEADCLVFQSSDRYVLMVDTGRENDYQEINNFLFNRGISGIDVLILTHPDNAHDGSLLKILQEYPVGLLVYPGGDFTDTVFNTAINYAKDHGIKTAAINIQPSDSGATEIPWSEKAEVLALSPFSGSYSSADDYSIILRVRFGNTSMLLSGDAGIGAERIAVKMLPNRYFHSNIVLLGNHGKNTSSCDKYLQTTSATIAVVSCGTDGPDKQVLERVKKYNMSLLRTDKEGTIHLRLDGTNASVVE